MNKRKKDKITNNDLQNTAQETKDHATRTPLKARVISGAPKDHHFLWTTRYVDYILQEAF